MAEMMETISDDRDDTEISVFEASLRIRGLCDKRVQVSLLRLFTESLESGVVWQGCLGVSCYLFIICLSSLFAMCTSQSTRLNTLKTHRSIC